MRAIVQRVKKAEVLIGGKVHSKIDYGYLIYLGVTHDDTESECLKLAKKIKGLRINRDKNDKMNLNLETIKGEILVVSQFTLYADTSRGNRPSFVNAASPEHAKRLYQEFIRLLEKDFKVQKGVFGADMEIKSINDGPVTILFETEEL